MNVKRIRRIATLAGMAMLPAIAANAGEGHDKEFGHPGQTAEVDRTIRVEARDIDFGHDEIKVRAGETVRFVVSNTGKMQHEFTIGPPAVQKGAPRADDRDDAVRRWRRRRSPWRRRCTPWR